jgi:hypothetical protein
MDNPTERPTPPHIVEACEASLRDIAEGQMFDAKAVQVEARRMLAEYLLADPQASVATGRKHMKPRRAA